MENCTQLLMNQVMHLYIQRSVQLFKRIDMHSGQAGMLWALRKQNGQSQKEIAEKLGVKPPSITVMLRKLEQGDYIVRKQDEKDQRITRLYITQKGIEAAEYMDGILKKLEKEIFANMSEEEIMLLRRLFMQMKDNLIQGREKDRKGTD